MQPNDVQKIVVFYHNKGADRLATLEIYCIFEPTINFEDSLKKCLQKLNANVFSLFIYHAYKKIVRIIYILLHFKYI